MKSKTVRVVSLITILAILAPERAWAMHISEGILPMQWAALWFVVAAPFVWMGLRQLRERTESCAAFKPFVGLVGAAVFIISCMPIPVPVAGTTAHPCGTGLAAILIGPFLTALISSVALFLQALFMAHGGITTLGANVVSMGVMGAFAGWATFRLMIRVGAPDYAAAFMAGLLSDWVTYAGTSLFLAAALHDDGSFVSMFLAIAAAFVPTQLPLGILEGFLTMGAYEFIKSRRPQLLAWSVT